jgi:hypothetical protein
MIVVVINQGLEVSNLDLFMTVLAFNQGVQLNHWEASAT